MNGNEDSKKKIKVLIIDDSALIRVLLTAILSEDPEIEIVGKVSDAYFAVDKIKQTNPDVLTLDIEMPKLNGLVFLENLMKSNPLPVIMISALTEEGSESTVKALQLGAVDFISKPKSDIMENLPELKSEIIQKIKTAALAKERITGQRKTIKSLIVQKVQVPKITNKFIAIGASTGGIEAIYEILKKLPKNIPPIVIVQHLPEKFVQPFAKRLDANFDFRVKVAEEGEYLENEKVLISRGDKHLELEKHLNNYIVRYSNAPRFNNHKPSIDVLFKSIAKAGAGDSIAVLLTGMGKDGALGLKEIKDAGGFTIAQSKKTCVVFGMPGEAVRLNAMNEIVDLDNISDVISKRL